MASSGSSRSISDGDELGVAHRRPAGLRGLERRDAAPLGAGRERDRGRDHGLPHPGVGAHHEDAGLVDHAATTARASASAPSAQSM